MGPRARLWIGGGAIVPLALLALLILAIRALDTRVAPTEPIEAEALSTASLDG